MRVVFAANIPPGATAEQGADLASVRYRAFIPAAAMRNAGQKVGVISIFDIFKPDFDPAIDLLVLHQPKTEIVQFQAVFPLFLERMQAIRNRGGIVALDVSDFKFTPEFHTRLARGIGEEAAKQYRAILDMIFSRSTVVTVPTESLADLMRRALGGKLPVFVIDDVVEVSWKPVEFAPKEELRLLWFGMASSHSAALMRFLKEDLPRIEDLRPTQMTLVCEPLKAATDGVLPRPGNATGAPIQVRPWSVSVLEQALADCDLVVLPFDVDSLLSRGKSNNRALQALYAGRAVVAHPIDSYLPLGAYIGLNRDLVVAVVTALADPAAMADKVKRGQAHVAGHYSPAAVGQRWLDLAGQLFDDSSI